MRSVLTLAALGLASSFGVSAAKVCSNTGRTSWTAKTSSTTGLNSATGPSSATGVSSATATGVNSASGVDSASGVNSATGANSATGLSSAIDLSSTIGPGGISTSGITTPGGSVTRPASSPTATASQSTPSIVVVNEIKGGDFAVYDAGSPGGLLGFDIGGNAHQVSGLGYTGDGATEQGCALLSTSGMDGLTKRQFGFDAMLQQNLFNLNPVTQYTVHFYYNIITSSFANTCRMEVYFAGMFFGATPFFPTYQGVAGNTPWGSFGMTSSIFSSNGFISFALVCGGGGSASVFIDQVFLSNNVPAGYFPQPNPPLPPPPAPTTTSSIAAGSSSTRSAVSGSTTQTGSQSNAQTGSQSNIQTGSQSNIQTGSQSNTQTENQATQTGSQSVTQTGNPVQTGSQSNSQTVTGQNTASTIRPSGTQSSAPTGTDNSCPPGIYAPGACFGATPTAEGSICSKQGFLSPAAPIWTIPATENPAQNSIHECALLCQLDSRCVAFALDVFHVGCIFTGASLSESGFRQDTTSTIYWSDVDCQTCILCDGETSPGPGGQSSSPPTATGQPGSITLASTANTSPNSVSGSATALPATTSTPSGPCSCSAREIIGGPIICRRDGYVQEEAWAVGKSEYPGQSSPERCAAICWGIRGCKASAYDSNAKQCVFIGTGLQSAGFTPGSSSYSYNWADIACWDCLSCPSASDSSTQSPSGNPQTGSNTQATPVTPIQTTSIPSTTSPGTTPSQPSIPNCECIPNSNAVSSNPRNRCGKYATVEREPILVPYELFGYQPSAGKCAAVCSSIRGCQSFAVDNENGGCKYLIWDLYSSGWQENPVSGSYWNDLGCYDCYPCINPGTPSSSTNTIGGSTTNTQTVNPNTETGSITQSMTFSTTHWSNSSWTQPTPSSTWSDSSAETPVPVQCSSVIETRWDNMVCGMPAYSAGNRLQSAGVNGYRIAPRGNLQNCAKDCLESADCISFAYNPSDTSCRLWTKGLSELALSANSQSGMWFYDRYCFSCGATPV